MIVSSSNFKKSKSVIWITNLSILGMDASTNTIDFLVDFGTMMVTLLTGTSNGEGYTTWMPCSNTSNFT